MPKEIYIDENGNERILSSSPSALSGLLDTDITTPSANQVLAYDGSKWGNTSPIDVQESTGAIAQSGTMQLNSAILKHNIIIVTFGRYGYGGTVVLSKASMENSLYSNGIGVCVGNSRFYTLSFSSAGLLTVVTSGDQIYITAMGLL